MPVEIQLPDGEWVRSDHLPFGVIADAAKKAETNWAHITEAPELGDGFPMLYLYEGACAHHGQEMPRDLTPATLPDRFRHVEEDIPDEYADGMPVLDPPVPASPEQG